jgi:hypothetical protein
VIVIIIVLLLVALVFIWYRKMFCFSAKETEKFEGTNYDLNRTSDYNYSKAATAPYNGGDYDYQPEEGRQSPPKTKPPIYDSDSGDDDGNQLISNSNAKYHKERLSQSNLRHSPSRTSPDRREDQIDYTTDYNPTADYNPAERSGVYASLNREKLGAKTRSPEPSPSNAVVYAELNNSAMSSHAPKDAYV